MVIVFTSRCTNLIKGIYSDSEGLQINEGNLTKESNETLLNSLKAISHQNFSDIQIILSTIGIKLNIVMICKRLENKSIKFTIIHNPIFRSNPAQDFVFRSLHQLTAEEKENVLESPLEYLKSIERSFLEIHPDDYLNYMPLMLNFYLDLIYKEIKMGVDKSDLESQPQNIFTLIDEVLRNEDLWNSKTSFNRSFNLQLICDESDLEEVDKIVRIDNEVNRFYYNVLVLAMKLNQRQFFDTLFMYKFDEQTHDTVENVYTDFVRLLYAHWSLPEDANRAFGYIKGITSTIVEYLSVKSRIDYYRLKGASFEKTSRYPESIDAYLTSVSLLDSLDTISPSAALSYAGIGNIHSLTGQYTKAITAYSFAASLFDYLSLEPQKNSMLRNILTVRTLKAKSYLSAGLISLNNERYAEADEYVERAVQEFALLLIETPQKQLLDSVTEVVSVITPLILRKDVEKNLVMMIPNSLEIVDSLLELTRSFKEGKLRTQNEYNELKALATPRKLQVHQVVLIYHDGTYITSLSSEDKLVEKNKNMLFAGAMTAIQLLLKEVIQSEKIHTIDAGENKILLRKAELIQVVIIANKITEEIIIATADLIHQIEEKYGKILANWDGSLKELRNATSLMKEFIYDAINE
ncbi:hypothetical protein EU534_01195 [Candidatus Heimdallarchaeota archaeon]|nr:MAG: hypothetical protein EU534_01195 [Candidatus Heimdallarchaeota archaeon]